MTTESIDASKSQTSFEPDADQSASEASAPVAAALATPSAVPNIHLQMPVSIRSLSLAMIAVLAALFVLHWAKAVFIPFMVGLLFSYALSPLVNWMESRRIPRAAGAAVVVLALIGGLGATAYSLSDDAVQLVNSLPAAAQKFARTIKARQGASASPLDTVQKAAAQIEQAAQDASVATTRGVIRVMVEPARFNIKDYLCTGTIGLATLLGQVSVVVFLTYFLMVSGNTFRRKLIKLAGPSLSSKKVTLQALDEITGQIQRYLQVQLATSALVGVLTGLALWAIGLENAAVWGIVAAVLNMVPYVGSLITAIASGGVAFLQFGSSNMAVLVASASIVIHTLVGNLLTPWLTSRASRMNPVAVFVGLLAWGWLWGVWGLLLGLPILMIVKSVCDRVDELNPVGEFLGA